MKTLGRYLPLGLLLGLLLAAILGFPGLVDAYLLRPIATSLWAGWRIVASVNQGVYWFLLVVLCGLLTLRVFSTRETVPASEEHRHKPAPRTRLEQWHTLFQNAARSGRDQAALRASLRNLIEATIAQPGEAPANDLDQALLARHISLPPCVLQYLEGPDGRGQRAANGPFTLLSGVGRALRARTGRMPAADESAIEEALLWMERAMEIRDGK